MANLIDNYLTVEGPELKFWADFLGLTVGKMVFNSYELRELTDNKAVLWFETKYAEGADIIEPITRRFNKYKFTLDADDTTNETHYHYVWEGEVNTVPMQGSDIFSPEDRKKLNEWRAGNSSEPLVLETMNPLAARE